jgi:hypothetical protein
MPFPVAAGLTLRLERSNVRDNAMDDARDLRRGMGAAPRRASDPARGWHLRPLLSAGGAAGPPGRRRRARHKSNISVNIRGLVDWHLVRRVRDAGRARTYRRRPTCGA